jgi:hypothetical protein
MGAFVKRMQRLLIAVADSSDERNPVSFGYGGTRRIGVEEVAKGCLTLERTLG